MPDYVTASDMETWMGSSLLIKLSNRTKGASTVNTDAVNEAIEAAESEVNMCLAARYTLPLTSPYPAVVVRLTKRVARYVLYDDHPATVPEQVNEDYKRAREDLKAIRTGAVNLGLTTSGTDADTLAEARPVVASGNARRLTRSNMQSF